MKKAVILSLMIALFGAAAVFAQEEFNLLGRYEDVKLMPENNTGSTNQFVFTRLVYNGRIPSYYKNWYTDYPRVDLHIIEALKRLTNIDIADKPRSVPINDPDLFKYPLIYSIETEQMVLTDEDAAHLREYLTRGGFCIIDDFWGTFEWSLVEENLKKILPGRPIKDIPLDHPVFHTLFDVDRLMQTPSGAYFFNGFFITYETDGWVPECKGIWDDKDRLMVVINHNTDLKSAYMWSDDPRYPERFSDYAYKLASNFIIYGLTH